MKRNILILGLLLLFIAKGTAQTNPDSVYTFCEVMPKYPGGDTACVNYLNSQIIIPQNALDSNVDGTIYIQFVVEQNGTLSNVQLKKGILKSLNNEIIRVIKTMPAWTPAKMNDSLVRAQIVLPVAIRQLDYLKFDSLVEYLDSSGLKVNKDSSVYYRVTKKGINSFLVSNFTNNGSVMEEWECKKLKPKIAHGRYVLYYENRSVKYEGTFVNDKKEGLFTYYNNQGRVLVKENYKANLLHGLSINYSVASDSDYVVRIYDNGELVKSVEKYASSNPIKGAFAEVLTVPEYPGGDDARMIFLLNNLKYPIDARDNGISGTVYIEFVIEEDGSMTNIKILKGAVKGGGVDGGLSQEALRVVKLMPSKWKPGTEFGEPVRTSFKLPVKFVVN